MKVDELFDLSDKAAVVTGGGDGIGRGCCEILVSAGASVVVSDIDKDKAQAVADGQVSDIAQAVLFLALPASAWINGQVLFVNGGGSQTLD